MSDPVYFERPQPGWQLITPGIYLDQENNMHVMPGELLRHSGWVDTPENCEMLYRVLPDLLREYYGMKNIPGWLTSENGPAEKV
jgi:hypothetical protein